MACESFSHRERGGGGREIFCEIYSFALAGKNLLMYNKNRKF